MKKILVIAVVGVIALYSSVATASDSIENIAASIDAGAVVNDNFTTNDTLTEDLTSTNEVVLASLAEEEIHICMCGANLNEVELGQ